MLTMKNSLITLLLLILTSCQNEKKEFQPILVEESVVAIINEHEGKKLMETHCYLCHSPNADENQGRIAPPMVAIKARYIDKERYTKEEFIAAVASFVENPTEDKALMYGALKKHGLMPKQAFPPESVKKIADFMFNYQIEEPTWFKEHWEGHGNKNWTQSGKSYKVAEKEKTYADIGLEYALGTKKILGKNLMESIQKKGTLEAMAFCNHKAIPLTDSMATKYNATIKRVSDKNRNPNNKANAEELLYIAQFKKDLAAKQEIKPVVIEKGNQVQFYYPIETNTMCLQCHGKPEQIKTEVRAKTLQLYPKDLAIGYSENEVRGIWSIAFTK
jgi:cytochrome c553